MREVGWTIRKFSRRVVNDAIDYIESSRNPSFNGIKKVLLYRNGAIRDLSDRDVAGIISYVISANTVHLTQEQKAAWASEARGKTKNILAGEIEEFGEVQKQLKEGKAADVSQIIHMLRSEVTSKAAQIGLDELSKYTSRPEVTSDAGAERKSGTVGDMLKQIGKDSLLKCTAPQFRDICKAVRDERKRREQTSGEVDELPNVIVGGSGIIGVLAKRFGVTEEVIQDIVNKGQ